jgi:D-inositol-3-phosphate glycosyltransferase
VSRLPNGLPRRIATLSVHTSPLDQPGTGDAGGLNVYVVQVAKRLAARGTEVEIFTRAVCRDTPPLAELAPGVLVRSVVAGPFEELDKQDLPAQVCQFTLEVLRAEAASEPGRYDLVHAHYWLSGKVGAAAKERWGVPLVQSMHTLGKVKNAALATGDAAEPDERIRGELEVVAAGRLAWRGGGQAQSRGRAGRRSAALRGPGAAAQGTRRRAQGGRQAA